MAISRPASSRSASVPSLITLASGVPSTHSVTSTRGAEATTRGTKISGSSAYAAANARLRLRLQLVVELLDDPVPQLRDQRLDVHAPAAGS